MKRQTFIKNYKILTASLCFCIIMAVLSAIRLCFGLNVISTDKATIIENEDNRTIVIDAGHGGEDGGAVGIEGTVEKHLNLSISQKLYDIYSFIGYSCEMTRVDDRLLYNEGQESRKKYYDLRNRVDFINRIENPVMISIHQNKFALDKYKGLQVYFSVNNGMSEILAENIQNNTKHYLQQDNNRQIKSAGKNIFILNNLNCPAVLVECGFISNADEEKKLANKEYQKKLAFIIFMSSLDIICEST